MNNQPPFSLPYVTRPTGKLNRMLADNRLDNIANFQIRAIVEVHSLKKHHDVQVWRQATHIARGYKVNTKRVTHELHFNGKDIQEAATNIALPNTDVAVVYWRRDPYEWRLIHDDDQYHIVTWPDLDEWGGTSPIVRKYQGRMVYLLIKLNQPDE